MAYVTIIAMLALIEYFYFAIDVGRARGRTGLEAPAISGNPEFERTDVLDGKAREQAWSGTAHALVAELGVGAATHSALMLALGIAGLLAGLGVVCIVMGVAFLWHTKKSMGTKVPDTVPESFTQDKNLETV